MTFRELLADQGVDVDDLLDQKIGEPIIGRITTGRPAVSIVARMNEDGAEIEIKVARF